MLWFWRLYEALRFIAKYRARQHLELARVAEERKLERDHQALLLKTFLTSLETIQETSAKESTTNAAALIKIAEAVAAQANGFGEWMKCFQVGAPNTSTVVRDEDEYRDEQLRLIEAGFPADIAALPEEFKLAWALKNDPNLLTQ